MTATTAATTPWVEMTPAQLDEALTFQLAVAWAGEAETRPPRLPWWRTALNDPSAGEDLLRRLAPKTWRWAVLEGARSAARRVDDSARKRSEDPDHLVTLFRLGFEHDEHLDDRLRELKLSETPPSKALPRLAVMQLSSGLLPLADNNPVRPAHISAATST